MDLCDLDPDERLLRLNLQDLRLSAAIGSQFLRPTCRTGGFRFLQGHRKASLASGGKTPNPARPPCALTEWSGN